MKETYLNKGVKWQDAVRKVANDTGMKLTQVHEGITTPKTKAISDEAWKAQSALNKNRQATKDWIESQNQNLAIKLLKKITGAIRGESVFGHGGIFVGTHAAGTLFQPKLWNKIIPAFLNGWKYAYGNEADYERAMAELKNRPLYLRFQRLGLQNDVDNYNQEEIQSSQKFLGKLSGAGQKGFNAIKEFRQDWAESEYNKLSDAEKKDDGAVQAILKLVNNGTGATNKKVNSVAREVMFAPGMEMARWGRAITNPAKATGYSLKWLYNATTGKGEMTPAQKVFVKTWAKRTGWSIGTYTGALLTNAAFQNTINPNNKVNLTDPSKPDFLKMKFGDMTIDATGGLLSVANLIRGMFHIAGESKKELKGETPFTAETKKVGGYLRGKLSPAYSIGSDFLAGEDYNKEVMPYSINQLFGAEGNKPSLGHHKMDWLEYGVKHLPLPLAETGTEIYNSALDNVGKDNRSTLNKVLTAITAGTISGTTGLRTGEYLPDEEGKFGGAGAGSVFNESQQNNPKVSWVKKDWNMDISKLSGKETIRDEAKQSKIILSKYPQNVQDKFVARYQENLMDVLGNIKDDGYVYSKGYKDEKGNSVNDISLPTKADGTPSNKPNGEYDEKVLKSITNDNERKQIISEAKKRAFEQTKKDILNQ
jgi:hypothetical protein